MATLVIMPRQGQSVESCVITTWKKNVGDAVAEGDVLFTYDTDKSTFDETAKAAGVLLARFHEEGDDVPCLEAVCVIGEKGEDFSEFVPKKEEKAAPKAEAAKAEAPKAEAQPAASAPAAAPAATAFPAAAAPAAAAPAAAGEMKISPRARHLAEKSDADLSKAVPTGPNGRIIERDVNALLDKGLLKTVKTVEVKPVTAPAAPAAAAAEAEYTDEKLTNIRKVIGKAMHASLSNMAQLTLNASFDATEIMAYRANLKVNAEKLGLANITLNDIVLFAVSRTLGAYKNLNANYLDDAGMMRYFSHVNLGVAVDTERGLLVPTLMHADTLSLNEIAVTAGGLIKEAQSGSISPDKLSGGSFTVTNLGSMGVESFTPVINPPQTGILGVDTIMRRVKVVDGKDVFYNAMGLSLTFDHRAIDGAPAAKFLKDLCNNLEHFNLLLAK